MRKAIAGTVLVIFMFLELLAYAHNPELWLLLLWMVLLFAGLTVYLGSEADYWRERSHRFYLERQSLVDKGLIKYDHKF